MFGWIVAIVLGLSLYMVHRASRKVVARSLRGRDARLTDEVSEYSGAYGADLVLGAEAQESVTRMYEKMCVLEPAKWAGDQRIPGIIEQYSSILKGRIADPEGLNVPSSRLLGRVNPDYEKYLKGQRKHTNGFKEALSYARHAQREEDLRAGFQETLISMGMPEVLSGMAASDARIETYTEEDWHDVISACKRISEEYGEDVAMDMLSLFESAEVLCSEEAVETYYALRQRDVPLNVASDVVCGILSVEQAERAALLVEGHLFGWQEAVNEVLSSDRAENEDERLRTEYRTKVTTHKWDRRLC